MLFPATLTRTDKWIRAVALSALVLTAVSFCAVTTFIGDDHLFLAFARYAPNPLLAFVRDQHGGEYYRPLPMVVWWLLGRAAGGSKFPFALLSFFLHLAVSLQVGCLVRAAHPRQESGAGSVPPSAASNREGLLAAALFFVAPVTQEAAFWYSASTDLLATAFGLATLLCLMRGRSVAAAALFAAACWSKESALVVPLLAVVVLHARNQRTRPSVLLMRVVPLLPVAFAYLAARTAVLGGTGRFGDPPAPLVGKLIQIASGLVHIAPGGVIASEPLGWLIGVAAWGALLVGLLRVRRTGAAGGGTLGIAAALWSCLSVMPLVAAPWIIGARYFYLSAVGVAWLAVQVLVRARLPVQVATLGLLAGLTTAQTFARYPDIASYEARLSAARRAVGDGLAHGFDTFHVASGIKDIDLAVKEDPRFAGHESHLVVLGDVPASFLALPPPRAATLDFLLARPALPPSGGYLFGQRRIVGLARRGDDPTLDEVLTRLPTIRFIRLRIGPQGRIIPRDVTNNN